jgi:hypothetical protein
MAKIHELIKYYTPISDSFEYDEWDLLGSNSATSKVI